MKFILNTAHQSFRGANAEEIIEKYPSLKGIGKQSRNEDGMLVVESDDFSVIQQILENVYGKIIISNSYREDNVYDLMIFDGRI